MTSRVRGRARVVGIQPRIGVRGHADVVLVRINHALEDVDESLWGRHPVAQTKFRTKDACERIQKDARIHLRRVRKNATSECYEVRRFRVLFSNVDTSCQMESGTASPKADHVLGDGRSFTVGLPAGASLGERSVRLRVAARRLRRTAFARNESEGWYVLETNSPTKDIVADTRANIDYVKKTFRMPPAPAS
jgi:hypothetical protein